MKFEKYASKNGRCSHRGSDGRRDGSAARPTGARRRAVRAVPHGRRRREGRPVGQPTRATRHPRRSWSRWQRRSGLRAAEHVPARPRAWSRAARPRHGSRVDGVTHRCGRAGRSSRRARAGSNVRPGRPPMLRDGIRLSSSPRATDAWWSPPGRRMSPSTGPVPGRVRTVRPGRIRSRVRAGRVRYSTASTGPASAAERSVITAPGSRCPTIARHSARTTPGGSPVSVVYTPRVTRASSPRATRPESVDGDASPANTSVLATPNLPRNATRAP